MAPGQPPEVSAACTGALTPILRDYTLNQGVGTYRMLTRGKETILKLFLSLPDCAAKSNLIRIRGGSVEVLVNGVAIGTVSAPTPALVSPYPQIAPYGSAPVLDGPGDPKFVIPGSLLQPASPADDFNATFQVTLQYEWAPDSRTTPTQTSAPFTLSTYPASTAPFHFEKTNALRVLAVPMGDLSSTATQFPTAARQAVENGMLTLSRLLPVQFGTGNLSGTTGGVRYALNPTLLDLRQIAGAYSTTTGNFCGNATNWNAIKAQLEGMLNAWNTQNPGATADFVLGAVWGGISDGSASSGSCNDGYASLNARAAWVRAVPDVAGTPSPTGSFMAMELSHLIGLQPSPRSSTTHSRNIQADAGTNRGYNIFQRKYVANDKTSLRYDTSTGPWNDEVSLLEREDYDYWACKLGGASNTECATPTIPVGTSSGVGAGPHFVIAGRTDLTAAGTSVLESYYAVDVASTEPDPSSPLTLAFVRGGVDEATVGVPLRDTDSEHDGSPGGGESRANPRPLFGASISLGDVGVPDFDRIELRTGATVLYGRDRNQRPVLSDVTGLAAGDPVNLSSDPGSDDGAPAVSPDGSLLAWSASASGGPGTLHVAPAGDLGSDATLPATTVPRKIAFERGGDIYTMNPDGTGITGLVVAIGTDTHPSWSPDGSQLVFASNRDGDLEIYRINADGTGLTQLTSNTVADESPDWSPDGTKIAFTRFVTGTAEEIFTMDPDGGNQLDITPAQAGGVPPLPDRDPRWSPDGTRIVFSRNFQPSSGVANDHRLRVIDRNGRGFRPVDDTLINAQHPAWSPDGSRIVFNRGVSGNTDLYIIEAHENAPTPFHLTTLADAESVATWSPDGDRIFFTRCCTGGSLLWQVAPDGTGLRQLTTSGPDAWADMTGSLGGATDPAWSADGASLAYSLDGDLYRVPVTPGPTPTLGSPVLVHERLLERAQPGGAVGNAIPPTSMDLGQFQSDTEIRTFREKTHLVLANPLNVDVIAPSGPIADTGDLTPGTIPAGTVINSHIVHADNASAAIINLVGSLTFDTEVLGIILETADLNATDALLAMPRTTYPTGEPSRGFDVDGASSLDRMTFQSDRRTIDITLNFSSAMDEFRVITRAAPTALRPTWSPDGSTIAFDDGADIFSTPSTGGALGGLASTTATERDPSWSRTPGLDRVAFERGADLVMVDPASPTTQISLTTNGADPDFADGRVAFIRGGDVWSVNTSGLDPQHHTDSGGTDAGPSIAGDALLFSRRFPLSVDVLAANLALDSVSATVADVDGAESDLRGQLLMRCTTGETFPLAVGLAPDALNDTLAVLTTNVDPTYACGNGDAQYVSIVSDGIETSLPTDPGATQTVPGQVRKVPVAAIHAPAIGPDADGERFLQHAAIPLRGQGYDPEQRVLDDAAHSWNVSGPSYPSGLDVGTGRALDVAGPEGVWAPGVYTARLAVTDADGRRVTVGRTFTIVADIDRDGIPDALETGASTCYIQDPDDPQADAYDDADGDGIPNIDDLHSDGGLCVTDPPADTDPPTITVDDGRSYTSSPALVPVGASDTLGTDGIGGLRGVSCTVDGDPAEVTPPVDYGSASYSGTVEVIGFGSHDITCTATDIAWNPTAATDSIVIDDGLGPTVSLSHTPPTSGWYASSPVQVAVSAADAQALVELDCTIDAAPASLTPAFTPGTSYDGTIAVAGDGQHLVACTARDSDARTAGDSTIVPIDTVDPTISDDVSPVAPDGANGWYVSPPTVTFVCADTGGSGIESCVADGQSGPSIELGQSPTGQTVGGTATDIVGNTATDSAGPFFVDLTNPTVTCDTPAPTFRQGESGRVVTGTVADTISGPATTTASAPADTSAIGSFTADVIGSDLAGRSGGTGCPYTVISATGYSFSGFLGPVDSQPTVNTGRRQKIYPVTWQLRDASGALVTNTSSFTGATTQTVTCGSLTGTRDALESTTRQMAGSIRFDTATGQFSYAHRAAKKAGCYELRITFDDGSSATALFEIS